MNKYTKILLSFFILIEAVFIFAVIFVLPDNVHFFKQKKAANGRILIAASLSRDVALTLNNPNKIDYEKNKNLLFVGDIMLDRGVKYYIKKNTVDYPFQEISKFLEDKGIVVGNLEGPIVKKPKVFSDDSLKFAFDSGMAGSLKKAGFKILSLANNHTLNMGQAGLEETRSLLKDADIDFVGDPVKCSEDFALEKEDMVFLGLNKTFSSNCNSEDIFKVIQAIKPAGSKKFFIVNIHWGKEYQLKSNASQQKLAHEMIDAGADLIIGHHPHVVQEIERYKGKMIFYSLGNFIFDQSFSNETTKGLSVEVEVYPDRETYKLFPIKIEKNRPVSMKEEDVKNFLNSLSEKSGKDLRESIKMGIIEISN